MEADFDKFSNHAFTNSFAMNLGGLDLKLLRFLQEGVTITFIRAEQLHPRNSRACTETKDQLP